jgi:undecaprenyl-diphosphatase
MQYRPTVILMIVLTAIAVPLSLLAAGDSTLPWDVAVTNRLQQVNSSGVEKAVNALNWYGRFAPVAVTSLIISIVLMAKRRYREAGFVLAVFLLSRSANGILKLAIGSPRPDGDLVRGSGQASGYGFPSGHAMSTLIFIGALIYLLYLNDTRNSLRVVALIAGFIFALGMGFSRIYVGAHWPSDVVGAYLWGGIFLVAIIAVYRWLRARNLGWR